MAKYVPLFNGRADVDVGRAGEPTKTCHGMSTERFQSFKNQNRLKGLWVNGEFLLSCRSDV